jgi:hypothetical protein
MEPRLKAGLWTQMAIRMADLANRPAMVLRRGDADAGGILCVLRGREGCVVLSQTRDPEGREAWMRGTGKDPVPEPDADAYVSRQTARDPDLWVIEFDTPDFKPPFEARLI